MVLVVVLRKTLFRHITKVLSCLQRKRWRAKSKQFKQNKRKLIIIILIVLVSINAINDNDWEQQKLYTCAFLHLMKHGMCRHFKILLQSVWLCSYACSIEWLHTACHTTNTWFTRAHIQNLFDSLFKSICQMNVYHGRSGYLPPCFILVCIFAFVCVYVCHADQCETAW